MIKAFVTTTGRSGTRSMSRFLGTLLRNAGLEGTARDHSDAYALITAGLDRLTRPDYDPGAVVGMLRSWRHEAEVNPGPCFILAEVLEAFGPDLPVIHLVRQRADFIESCKKHIVTGPERWGNFIDTATPAEVSRPTAVHFGDMTQAEWDNATLHDRVAWLYDAHLRETARHLPHFARHITVRTEDLNRVEEQQRIAEFLGLASAGGGWMPWIGWTQGLSYARVNRQQADHIQRSLQFFDWNQAVADRYYAFMHFAQTELAWFMQDPDDPQRRRNLMMVRDAIDEAFARHPDKAADPSEKS